MDDAGMSHREDEWSHKKHADICQSRVPTEFGHALHVWPQDMVGKSESARYSILDND